MKYYRPSAISNRYFKSLSQGLPILALACSLPALAQEQNAEDDCQTGELPQDKTYKVGKLEYQTNPIFDESQPDTIALHRFANWMHVNTRDTVIADRMPFAEGDQVDAKQLAEAERLIRKEPYVRDAKVSYTTQCEADDSVNVKVTTWDNWSLLPTLSFGRKGGANKYAFGFEEDNLLGYGIRARVQYKSDAQRSGYQFSFRSPSPFVKHATVFADFESNDDGDRTQLAFIKPFYELSTQYSVIANYLLDTRTEDVFQNGGTNNTFIFDGHTYEFGVGKLLSNEDHNVWRVSGGYTDDVATFLLPELPTMQDMSLLPQDRHFRYPWVELEYLQDRFQVMEDIYLINQSEDINLGWQHKIRVGLETNDTADGSSVGYHVRTQSTTGMGWDGSLMLFSLGLESDLQTSLQDRVVLSGEMEYFHRLTPKIGLYASLAGQTSTHQFGDIPIALGGESGVRGYPLQYQHGDHRAAFNAEVRYYPQINLYRLFDVGFVAFADVGQAWGGKLADNNELDSTLSSAGIGARIYSNRSSHSHVIHIDIAKPLATAENVDSWQWRMLVKETF